jgi:hypothetical protein
MRGRHCQEASHEESNREVLGDRCENVEGQKEDVLGQNGDIIER